MKKTTGILLLMWLLCLNGKATTYYFAANGLDTRTSAQAQNPATPWRSLVQAQAIFPTLGAGDELRFKAGDQFDGSLNPAVSGTLASPILITTWNDNDATRAIFDGRKLLNAWTYEDNGIYSSTAFTIPSGGLNMVTIDGKAYAMGRFPNKDAANDGYLTFESVGTQSITDNQNPLTGAGWVGAFLEVRTTHSSLERVSITSISGNTIHYNQDFITGYTALPGYGYFVMGSMNTLDQYGEWYYNKTDHKLYVYFGDQDPTKHVVNAATTDILVECHGSHIKFKNICFRYANRYAIFNDWANMQDLIFDDCKFNYSGINAMFFVGLNGLLVQNCTIANSMSNGIVMNNSTANMNIINNVFRNTAMLPGMAIFDDGIKYGTAIQTKADHTTITDNEIYNTGYIGINFSNVGNVDIEHNYIDTSTAVLDDGGAIYTITGTFDNTVYTNRVVKFNTLIHGIGYHKGTPDNEAFGGMLYFDNNSQNVDVQFNTIANSDMPGIFILNSKNLIISNNLVFNNTTQVKTQHSSQSGAFSITGLTMTGNTLFSKKAAHRIYEFASVNNDFASMGTIENNFYCRPFDESNIILLSWFGNWDRLYSLQGTANTTTNWQNVFAFDQNTKKTPIAVTNERQIFFTTSKKVTTPLKFCKNCVDMAGTLLDLKTVPAYQGFLAVSPSLIVP